MIRLGFAWLGLVVLLAVELVAALAHAGWIAYLTTPFMVLAVAAVFMHATSASPLSRIFAITGLFWIAILLGIGVVDYAVRNETRATALSPPYDRVPPAK